MLWRWPSGLCAPRGRIGSHIDCCSQFSNHSKQLQFHHGQRFGRKLADFVCGLSNFDFGFYDFGHGQHCFAFAFAFAFVFEPRPV